MTTSLQQLQTQVIAFRDERDWRQYHTPKDLTAALAIEAAELQEQLLWKSPEQVATLLQDTQARTDFEDEMADVLAYLLCLAEVTGTDLAQALAAKLKKNAEKYPADRVRGRADKYTAYSQPRGKP